MIYDLFYVSRNTIYDADWEKFRARFPLAQKIENVDTFNDLKRRAFTKLFWVVWDDLEVAEDFNFSYEVPEWDESYHHVFKNNQTFDGVVLLSKASNVSNKEVQNRFFVNSKEVDVVASTPKKYDIFTISTFADYQKALEETTTELFWSVPPDVIVADDFDFSFYFPQYDRYNRTENHVFEHQATVGTNFFGIGLYSTHKTLSKREVEFRFPAIRKEWNIIASVPQAYDQFIVDTYEDYQKACEETTTDLFWCIWKEYEIIDDVALGMVFDFNDQYDRKNNHVFKHRFRGVESCAKGIALLSPKAEVSAREIKHRAILDKKEHDVLVSIIRPYDIVFIESDEPNAEDNYKKLVERFPRAKRIVSKDNVYEAYRAAANTSETDMFWAVTADAIIADDFYFDVEVTTHETEVAHVWLSLNSVNELTSDSSGVKLLPKAKTLKMDVSKPNVVDAITSKVKDFQEVSNVLEFNTNPWQAWKTGFIEYVKLYVKTLDVQVDPEVVEEMEDWCNEGFDAHMGDYTTAGARHARCYCEEVVDDVEKLAKINDITWLKERFYG